MLSSIFVSFFVNPFWVVQHQLSQPNCSGCMWAAEQWDYDISPELAPTHCWTEHRLILLNTEHWESPPLCYTEYLPPLGGLGGGGAGGLGARHGAVGFTAGIHRFLSGSLFLLPLSFPSSHAHPPPSPGTILSLHCKALVNVPRPLYWWQMVRAGWKLPE